MRKFSIFQATPCQGSNKERREAVAGGRNKYFRARKRVNRKGPVQPEVGGPHLRWCNLPDNRIPSQRPLQFASGLHKYCKRINTLIAVPGTSLNTNMLIICICSSTLGFFNYRLSLFSFSFVLCLLNGFIFPLTSGLTPILSIKFVIYGLHYI